MRSTGLQQLPIRCDELPGEKPPQRLNMERWIDETVGALTYPIITWPSPWMDTMPGWMKERVPLDRLAHLMRCSKGEADIDEATDLEALMYMYPLTLEHPINRDWTEIYLYLSWKVMGDKVPEDIRHTQLTRDQEVDLRRLKQWIKAKQRKAFKEKKKEEGRQEQTQQEEQRSTQRTLFE